MRWWDYGPSFLTRRPALGLQLNRLPEPQTSRLYMIRRLLQTAPANQSTLAPATELSTALEHRLETMGNNIAVMHRFVERLAARQEQMAQDIATLQTAQKDMIDKISTLARPLATTGPPGKKISKSCPLGSTGAITFDGVSVNPLQPRVPLR
jgi:hypothetical protein